MRAAAAWILLALPGPAGLCACRACDAPPGTGAQSSSPRSPIPPAARILPSVRGRTDMGGERRLILSGLSVGGPELRTRGRILVWIIAGEASSLAFDTGEPVGLPWRPGIDLCLATPIPARETAGELELEVLFVEAADEETGKILRLRSARGPLPIPGWDSAEGVPPSFTFPLLPCDELPEHLFESAPPRAALSGEGEPPPAPRIVLVPVYEG